MTQDKSIKAREKQEARKFSRIRAAHRLEAAEDYVELIADLAAEKGVARMADLARFFGVSQPTVNKTVQRLEREGYVTREPYGPLFLTKSGRALAEKARQRHQIVCDFLIALGLDAALADQDAEGIEHHVSRQTLDLFKKWTEKLRD